MGVVTAEMAVVVLLGALTGAIIGWLVAKYRADSRMARLEATSRVEIDAQRQALENKKREADSSKSGLDQAHREIRSLHQQLLETTRDKAAAQSKLEELDRLQNISRQQAAEIRSLDGQVARLKSQQGKLLVILKKERLATQEKLDHIQELRRQMQDAFKSLSVEALRDNHQSFIDAASATFAQFVTSAQKELAVRHKAMENTVHPLKEALERYESHLRSLERHREKAYGGLKKQMDLVTDAHRKLRHETGQLVKALRKPHVRGRWGEMTLKRVVEASGMMNHCDFREQPCKQTGQGLLRPDMVIHLPHDRQIVVDAKVPLEAYLEATEAETDAERNARLADHLKQLQTHISQLSQKAYWKQFQPTPEFVIMFIPGENFFSAALMQRPQLIEEAAHKQIVLASPSTLITLLKSVAYGWHQTTAAENAQMIVERGRELYERFSQVTQHLSKLGKELGRSVSTYNLLIGSIERRLLTTVKKFDDLGVPADNIKPPPALKPISSRPRELSGQP